MGRRISKEFLHPSILEGVNDKIGNLDSLETDAKGNMVQAINELVEKLDNSAEIESGKELIANAVGEPLTAEESFDEMSNDINSLLSTFKTNMMNNGITVESGDKFKSLIDKIATMVEEGQGKGIQYITGSLTTSIDGEGYATISVDAGFLPNILIGYVKSTSYSNYIIHSYLVYIPELLPNIVTVFQYQGNNFINPDGDTCDNLTINNTKLTMKNVPMYQNYNESKYYAIGVGEEDTTLRDSLADILENKGVDVTEEDDMASLITKVDSITDEFCLYNYGNTYDHITGGWSMENTSVAEYGYESYAQFNINEDHLYIFNRTYKTNYTRIYPNNSVDLSKYNKLCVEANTADFADYVRLFIWIENNDTGETHQCGYFTPTTSSLTYTGVMYDLGEYESITNATIKIGIKPTNNSSAGNLIGSCHILKITLIK